MKAQTNKLAALIKLVLKKNSEVIVAETEITEALDAIDTAIDMLPLYSIEAFDSAKQLREAARVVSYLVYSLTHHFSVHFSCNYKNIPAQANRLHTRIQHSLSVYCAVPGFVYSLVPFRKLLKTLAAINVQVQPYVTVSALYVLIHHELCAVQKIKTLCYHRWLWWSQFFAAVHAGNIGDVSSLEELLIRLNYNTPEFVQWLIRQLRAQIAGAATITARQELVTQQFLRYTTEASFTNGYLPAEQCVQETMLQVLRHLLLCQTAEPYPMEPGKTTLKKLDTVLAVPQLAVFTRLMIDTKIVNHSNCSAVLRYVAAGVSTNKASSISFESLRVNFYTPNTATKVIMKEYLFKMISLLKTYD